MTQSVSKPDEKQPAKHESTTANQSAVDSAGSADGSVATTANESASSDSSTTDDSKTSETGTSRKIRNHKWAWKLGCCAVIAMFSSWLVPRITFVFHTIANFQLQLVALVMITVFFMLLSRRYLAAFVLAALVALPTYHLAKLYFPASDSDENSAEVAATGESTRKIRLMTFNVLKSNDRYEDTLNLIREVDADVVGLLEFSGPWQRYFEDKLLEEYPYRVGPKIGKCVLSKFPIGEIPTRISNANPWFNGWLETRFWVDDQMVHFILTHTLSPKNHSRLVERNGQFKGLGQRSQVISQYMHVVLAGDFNGTTHDYELSTLLDYCEFKDSRQGFGLQNSWPTWFWPMSICIDQCFVSKLVRVHDRKRGPDVGSDHLPIIVELSFGTHEVVQKPHPRLPPKSPSSK